MNNHDSKTRWDKMQEVSERVDSIRNKMLNTTPEIFTDRAVLITESYQGTMGQPYIIRRARALENILLNMDICIQDNQLIAGCLAGKSRGCQVFPEYGMDFIINELDLFDSRTADQFTISEENKQILRDIYPAWENNTIADSALDNFPDDAQEYAEDLIYILTALRSGVGHVMIDYERGLNEGLLSIIEKVESLQEQISINDPEYQNKINYYQAVKIVCRAVIQFAERFAELAEKEAEKNTDNGRRQQELLNMAHICRKVPAQPAETFPEAIQSFWFLHLILHILNFLS